MCCVCFECFECVVCVSKRCGGTKSLGLVPAPISISVSISDPASPPYLALLVLKLTCSTRLPMV